MIFTDAPKQQKTGTRFIGDKGWVHVDRAGIWAEPESLLKVKLKADELHLNESKHHQDDFLTASAAARTRCPTWTRRTWPRTSA